MMRTKRHLSNAEKGVTVDEIRDVLFERGELSVVELSRIFNVTGPSIRYHLRKMLNNNNDVVFREEPTRNTPRKLWRLL